MSTPSKGISGPSGRIGLQPFHGQPFIGNYRTPEPVLTQISPEQSMADEIRKLTVSLLIESSDLIWVHHGDKSTLSKRSWRRTRYPR